MAEVRRIISRYCDHLAGIVRDRESEPERIREALGSLGAEMARRVLEDHYLEPAFVTTPLDEDVEVLVLAQRSTLIVTTKSDFDSFGAAVASVLAPARVGYMDFEGRRGLEALNSPVRDMSIPTGGGKVGTLVVAKSTLATGCTAISLTRHALEEVDPHTLVVTTIFYSLEGLQELCEEFPNAMIYCIGEPDSLDDNGILHPGIGMLDDRVMRE